MRRAALAALATLFLAGCKGDADFSEAAPKPVVLPAEEYKGEITAIDRLAFAPEPLTAERRTDLGARLEGLAARIKAASPERFIALEALELRALAGRARSLPDAPPPERLQREWMRIRNNLFDDRAWFARGKEDFGAEPLRP